MRQRARFSRQSPIIWRYTDKRLRIVGPLYDSLFFTTYRNRRAPHGLLDDPVSVNIISIWIEKSRDLSQSDSACREHPLNTSSSWSVPSHTSFSFLQWRELRGLSRGRLLGTPSSRGRAWSVVQRRLSLPIEGLNATQSQIIDQSMQIAAPVGCYRSDRRRVPHYRPFKSAKSSPPHDRSKNSSSNTVVLSRPIMRSQGEKRKAERA
jgi:hypothetical protein